MKGRRNKQGKINIRMSNNIRKSEMRFFQPPNEKILMMVLEMTEKIHGAEMIRFLENCYKTIFDLLKV